MKKLSQEEITDKLHQDHFTQGPGLERLSDPVIDTPMLVTLEQLRPYEHNPRFIRNPVYDDIKASIRERGLDQPPPITRRPGEASFIIRNGGNTRLAILGELWQETRDERFFRIHCLFRPWSNEITALLGHLAESDLHGQLTFIERALAVAKLKTMLESDGADLSQRELARRLAAGGYPISQSHISRMMDTLEHLLPAIPQTLYAGLGKPQIERLIGLRSQAERAWNRYPTAAVSFAEFWLETMSYFDGDPESFDLEQIQDELLERMSHLLGQSYRMLALELSDTQRVVATPRAVTTTPSENSHRPSGHETAAESPSSDPNPESTDAQSKIEPISEERLTAPEKNTSPAVSHLSRVQQIREQIDREISTEPTSPVETCPIDDIWIITPQLDTPEQLRLAIAGLAREMAAYAGDAESIIDQKRGLGFALNIERLDLSAPRSTGVHLMLLALLRAQDEVNWEDRKQIPSALFGQLLLGVYQLPLPDRPVTDVGLERLPDSMLIKLFRLIRLARRLIDLTLIFEDKNSPEELR
ncbi:MULTISPECIES: ParB family protein [Pseudomonas]|jgi:ParB family protein of integrating conjugative element (PFGI_1 class)|uniref:Chromosome partitioning protein ParB n=1 Tax=Pseudomonas extremaustralis TaxID=359110 RepID=A0A5C5QCC4_9PSED|nr:MULTISPECIES: ParB family protein [Pseudomonas]HCE9343915.1 chromosome partitioning protein ParB [Pseudomonas aeruginosa]EZI27812.1 chromosome partitioning protein ParB [Pseudomonas extremaustralis 14-3 substr. 14-3b]MBJ2281416.1 chromosome partitioning protein ParB [Pseudomonas sp. MF6767]MDW8841010.1 chromosome partitioning protein ParB [Pseudomonas carnis]NMX83476.1 chromosome partitioning protein ParB [Pseudomonas sp. WS 5503]